MDEYIFTLTLIKDGDNSRILVIPGEAPAKADDEAEAIVSEKLLPDAYKEIVKAIPNFKEAEDGCEDWVSHTIDEFLDIYDLDLIKVFETAEEESVEKANELSDEDKTGENTPEDSVDDVDVPEFDIDLFGDSAPDTTSPEEVFFIPLNTENLQSKLNSIQF